MTMQRIISIIFCHSIFKKKKLPMSLHSQAPQTKWDGRKKKMSFTKYYSSILVSKLHQNIIRGTRSCSYTSYKLIALCFRVKKPNGNPFFSSLIFRITNNFTPRILSCTSFVHVHSHHRGKLNPIAIKCVFVGYSSTQKGHKCYHPPTKKFYIFVDVTFAEKHHIL